MNLPNGQVRDVLAYTEKDRELMETVWQGMGTAPILALA